MTNTPAPDARCTAGCTCADCVAANDLADRFDAMEARQAEAEERLNDYRYDSEDITEVPGPDSCAACVAALPDYERLYGDGSCLACFTSNP